MTSRPLRVLFLTPYFRPYLGGIERAIEQLTFQIQKSHDVEAVGVLTTKYSFPRIPEPDWSDRETTSEGIAIYRLSGYPQRSIPLYSVPLVWFSPLRVRRYLKEFNPNVVHFVGDGWFWGHFWTWFWFRRRARFVFTPSFHTLPLSRWWIRPINGFLCNVVDRVIALTQLESRRVRRAYWVPKRKQGVIGWGAALPESAAGANDSPQNFQPEPGSPSSQVSQPDSHRNSQRGNAPVSNAHEEAGEGQTATNERDTVTILCVGRLGQHKGQSWLLDVYHQARAQFQIPARLVMVGRDEGDEEKLKQTVLARGLENEVSLPGEASDSQLANWYSQAGVLALFSRYEAFGLVYFEAMAYGVPVLTHDVGANRELLVRGAVVVPQFDKEAAIRELVRLVNDKGYREELGRDAKSYALAEFTWPTVAAKYLQEYQATAVQQG